MIKRTAERTLAAKIGNQPIFKPKERSQTLPKESELNYRAIATLFEAVYLQVSPGLKL